MPNREPLFKVIEHHPAYESDKEFADKLIGQLKRARRYNSSLLYTGVQGVPWQQIQLYGADNPARTSTFALREQYLYQEEMTLVDYAGVQVGGEDSSAILVYESKLFTPISDDLDNYNLEKGRTMKEALVAAFRFFES